MNQELHCERSRLGCQDYNFYYVDFITLFDFESHSQHYKCCRTSYLPSARCVQNVLQRGKASVCVCVCTCVHVILLITTR